MSCVLKATVCITDEALLISRGCVLEGTRDRCKENEVAGLDVGDVVDEGVLSCLHLFLSPSSSHCQLNCALNRAFRVQERTSFVVQLLVQC